MRPQPQPAAKLAVVIVSHRSERWLNRCLRSLHSHAATDQLEVVVVENGGSVASRRVAKAVSPAAVWVEVANTGFGAANNHGVRISSAPYILLLNPDTEVIDGALADLLDLMDADERVGMIGVRHLDSSGALLPTIRRFPSATRWLGEALGSEKWPTHPAWSGERDLDLDAYDTPRRCDWTVGAFMLLRRTALAEVGGLHEGYFLYYEEPDLCLRLGRAGWRTEHRPEVTIVHHGGNESTDARHAAQLAYARRAYMERHFSHPRRLGATAVLALGYGTRAVVGGRLKGTRGRARAALATLLARRPVPPLAPSPPHVEPAVAHGAQLDE